MAKIGIYIPDAKMAEITAWQQKLNFSEIFRNAFDRAVVNETALSKIGDKEMQNVVKRLKQEQEQDYQIGYKVGTKDGTKWAKDDASLKQLRRVAEEEIDSDGLVDLLADNWFERDYVQDQARMHEADFESFLEGYTKGFIEGASSVWDGVKGQL